jgi:hypothetical protein
MAWTIAEDINGIKVTLNPSPINKIAIVALIGSVLRTRNSSPPLKLRMRPPDLAGLGTKSGA